MFSGLSLVRYVSFCWMMLNGDCHVFFFKKKICASSLFVVVMKKLGLLKRMSLLVFRASFSQSSVGCSPRQQTPQVSSEIRTHQS